MSSICSPNEEMSWKAVKEIVDGIDGLASSLRTPDYIKLREDERRPFKFDDVQRDITFYQAFDLNPGGGGVITERYLSEDAYGNAQWEPSDDVLKNMAEDGDLFFVADPDGCICKTIFKVSKTAGKYTLEEIPEMGCCQSLFVPDIGGTLPAGQNIVPTRPLASYIRNGNPFEGQMLYDGGICRANAHGVGYKFASTEKNSPLETVARKFTGYLTWMARADYMAAMWGKLEFILHCCRNGGSESGVWWNRSLDPPAYRETECSPTLCEVISTLEHDGDITDEPGCLFDADVCVKPWEAPTCGGEECDSEGPKFYCETLNQLDEVIKKIKEDVRDYPSSGKVGCCCDPGYVLEGVDGESIHCSAWHDCDWFSPPDPQCWVIEGKVVTVCTWMIRADPDNPSLPFDVPQSSTGTTTQTWSGEVVQASSAPVGCLSGSYSSILEGDELPDPSDYDDYECGDDVCTLEIDDPPTAGELIGVAVADAIANGGPSGSVSYGYTGHHLETYGYPTPCEPGKGYAGAHQYRITLTPPNACPSHCPDADYVAQTVPYDLVLFVNGVESSRTAKSISCEWDSGEGEFRSSLQNFPSTSATGFYYAIEFDAENERQLCLEC